MEITGEMSCPHCGTNVEKEIRENYEEKVIEHQIPDPLASGTCPECEEKFDILTHVEVNVILEKIFNLNP